MSVASVLPRLILSSFLVKPLVLGTSLALASLPAFAASQGGQVVGGQASITQSARQTTITLICKYPQAKIALSSGFSQECLFEKDLLWLHLILHPTHFST